MISHNWQNVLCRRASLTDGAKLAALEIPVFSCKMQVISQAPFSLSKLLEHAQKEYRTFARSTSLSLPNVSMLFQ